MTEGVNLDIGSRDMPVMIDSLREDLAPNGKIICIDKRAGWLMRSRPSVKNNYDLVSANGETLPVANNTVDFIYAKDLFGAHGIAAITPDKKLVIEDVGENLPQEWFRVCKPGAKVVIMELATPFPRKELINQFSDAGFKLSESNEELDANLVYKKEYRGLTLGAGDHPYSLVLKKP